VNYSGGTLYTNYCMPGMSITQAPYAVPYAIVKTRLWDESITGLPRLFSYDACVYDGTPGPDSGNVMRTFFPRAPHLIGGVCVGMNMTTVDGAGQWLDLNQCRRTTWGWWVYYQRVFPQQYEMLSQVHRSSGSMQDGSWPYASSIPATNATIHYGTTNTYARLNRFGYFQP